MKFIYKEHYHKGVVWSLFDGSGGAVIDWAKAGYLCLCFNAEGADHGSYAEVITDHPNIHYVDYWIDPWFNFLHVPGSRLYSCISPVHAFSGIRCCTF